MSSNEEIERLVVEASSAPLDPVRNFDVAVAYERLGQTASAVGFYLCAAEHGYESQPLVTYASLLKVSTCIDRQGGRKHTVSNAILQAAAYLPERPEAYFLLSRFYEQEGSWQECYTYATVGLETLRRPQADLPVEIDDYRADCALEFQAAISAWWIGRGDESIERLLALSKQPLPEKYAAAVRSNLQRLGS
jgi:hypothetical protein